MVLCRFLLSVRKNSSPPSITYCAFWFAIHPSHVVCTFSCLFPIPCAILLSVWQFLLAQFHRLATSPIFGSHIAHVLMQNAYRWHLAVPWALQNTYIVLLVTPPLDILKMKVGILIIFWLIQLWFLGVADLCFATPAYLQCHPLPSDLFFCGTAWLWPLISYCRKLVATQCCAFVNRYIFCWLLHGYFCRYRIFNSLLRKKRNYIQLLVRPFTTLPQGYRILLFSWESESAKNKVKDWASSLSVWYSIICRNNAWINWQVCCFAFELFLSLWFGKLHSLVNRKNENELFLSFVPRSTTIPPCNPEQAPVYLIKILE